ncbi:DUF416 family protein [Tuwongella immobilis]|uniref:Uncharacterized protein n=1 Tax=Tuwongella immobilis TaxID=692036 RepID=A0A6C2YGY9_9BACT|nr:DUF416 family protein [Tuwongella immobilis]VIP00790.1 unnamed protein product [Tuwongella immobilis]VTR96998.1 unnamed protein product [Tuwongella immobilis]
MFSRITQHMEDVKRALVEMSPNGAFAFALNCTERQWPLFQRAAESVPWVLDWQGKLRHDLDATWQYVVNGTLLQFSDSLVSFREHLLSWVAGPSEVEDADGFSSAIIQTIANSVANILDGLQNGNVSSASFPANSNLDLLDLLLDECGVRLEDLGEESGDDPAEISAVRELIEQELQQQDNDIQALRKDSSAAGIQEVRQTSAGRNLFGRVWAS